LQREIITLCHAVQSGVAACISVGRVPDDTTPKHLRTGINLTKCDHAALVLLLVRKGLITELEYFEAVRDMVKKEVADYESILSKIVGKKVGLA